MPEPLATHLLQGAIAQPLLASGTTVEVGVELHCDNKRWLLRGEMIAQVRLNDAAYPHGTALKPGDSITSSSGMTSVLIEVQP